MLSRSKTLKIRRTAVPNRSSVAHFTTHTRLSNGSVRISTAQTFNSRLGKLNQLTIRTARTSTKTTSKAKATSKAASKAKKIETVTEEEDSTPKEPSQRKTSSTNSSVEELYQKKTPVEHVLLRPDTYIGGTVKISSPTWIQQVVKEKGSKSPPQTVIVHKDDTSYVPGLFKIFDEILVNAADNKQRDSSMDEIRVDVDVDSGTISVYNNGKGIPVKIHKKEGIYVPELVFGHLFTGSNFDDSIVKVTGGRNGYGAKLTNIFSKEFIIETVDSKSGYKYIQKWKDNMSVRTDPQVIPLKSKESDYTKVTFKPDLSKFGMQSLTEGDILSLIYRRVYDIAGCNETVKVFLNGELLPNTFEDYLSLYQTSSNATESPKVLARINSRWQVGIGVSKSGQFTQVSFVNSINTSRGGTHVNYITEQVARYLLELVNKRYKDLNLNINHVKNHLAVYVNCLIENPAFDSQTKETLTTRPDQFGSECNLKKPFLQQIVETTNILEHIANWAKFRQQSELAKQSATKPQAKVLVPKLYDANQAGGPKSSECTLILTEGDSAKALAIAGLSVLGRDYYGVFPLRGKLLNVRDATLKQLINNAEISSLVKILGLNYKKTYKKGEERDLRYGKVMLMTDQDHDGSHIKGLFINFIHKFWPALLEQEGFLEEFITPIVKATKGKQKHVFFTIPEYEQWKNDMEPGELSSWKIKYYKGLGTSTAEEAKEYFSDLKRHQIYFKWSKDATSLIEMAFAKENSSKRKDWLASYKDNTYVDHSNKELTISNFINKELILFSRADNIRSIPSMIDGLKPGQRKVLYACFKRKLKDEIKVAQLAGYVSEQTAYHHGEASLHSTIIHMAQNYVGANNIPLLQPSGQFGTRLQGGKDAASARYLFTNLRPITRKIFPEIDDPLLNYLEDDGQQIQPVIPMVLVNGAEGLGTGWSTYVPMYNPLDIIENLLNVLSGKSMKDMTPWVRGFTGTIEPKGPQQYVSRGVVEKLDSTTLLIKELPLGTWVDDYKLLLDSLVRPERGTASFIKSYTMQHKGDSAHFIVKLPRANVEEAEQSGMLQKFKLESTFSTSNMNLFNSKGQLQKYDSPLQIIEEFFDVRKNLYDKRKKYLLDKLEKEDNILKNKVKFLTSVANGQLKIGNRSKRELLNDLQKLGLSKSEDGSYDYLLNTPLWNITKEKIENLLQDREAKEKELKALKSKSGASMWEQELEELRELLQKELTQRI